MANRHGTVVPSKETWASPDGGLKQLQPPIGGPNERPVWEAALRAKGFVPVTECKDHEAKRKARRDWALANDPMLKEFPHLAEPGVHMHLRGPRAAGTQPAPKPAPAPKLKK